MLAQVENERGERMPFPARERGWSLQKEGGIPEVLLAAQLAEGGGPLMISLPFSYQHCCAKTPAFLAPIPALRFLYLLAFSVVSSLGVPKPPWEAGSGTIISQPCLL